jgi:Mn-dependent DtxR family transcriptional regulator
MSLDGQILRALLRLARRRSAASTDDVALRVRAEPRQVRARLRRLRAHGLVAFEDPECLKLTLPGLAFAVASLPRPRERITPQDSGASRAA